MMLNKTGIKVTVKFTGAPQAIVGARQIVVDLEEGVAYKGVIQKIADMYPALVGWLIADDRKNFLSSNAFLVNNENYILEGMWDQCPQDGDELMIVSLITGG
jgi:molybdopterin converting factor small subunit